MRRVSAIRAACAVLLLASLACKKEEPRAGSAGDPKAGAAPAAGPLVFAEEVSVRLLEAGSEPRRALRFSVAKDQVEKISFVMDVDMELGFGAGAASKASFPTLRLGIEQRITDVTAAGDVTYEFRVASTSVGEAQGLADSIAGPLKGRLARLNGCSGRTVASSRGITRSAELRLPGEIDEDLRQVLEGLRRALSQPAAPFPEEPVGVGAKWRAERASDTTVGGIKSKVAATYERKEISGDSVALRVEIEQSAPPQELPVDQSIAAASGGGGIKARLKSYSGKGGGDIAVDTRRVSAASSALRLESSFVIAVNTGDRAQDATNRVAYRLVIGKAD